MGFCKITQLLTLNCCHQMSLTSSHNRIGNFIMCVLPQKVTSFLRVMCLRQVLIEREYVIFHTRYHGVLKVLNVCHKHLLAYIYNTSPSLAYCKDIFINFKSRCFRVLVRWYASHTRIWICNEDMKILKSSWLEKESHLHNEHQQF
jgi:hypothetical protein